MNKTGIISLMAALSLPLTGCNGDAASGKALLERAQAAFEAGNYSLAKLQIDSIRTLYPKAFDARKAGIRLMQQVDLKEQEKSIRYLDSMKVVKQAAFDSIKGEFVFEKDTAYQETGNYFYPTQVVEKNIGRSYLRAQVSERGEMYLTSVYCGRSYIHHNAVRVSDGNTFAETPATNDSYETTVGGQKVEVVEHKSGKDGGVIAFIESHVGDRSLKVEFKGEHNYTTLMNASDIKAVAAVSQLARILGAIEEINKEKREAELKIRFINKRREEQRQLNAEEASAEKL